MTIYSYMTKVSSVHEHQYTTTVSVIRNTSQKEHPTQYISCIFLSNTVLSQIPSHTFMKDENVYIQEKMIHNIIVIIMVKKLHSLAWVFFGL